MHNYAPQGGMVGSSIVLFSLPSPSKGSNILFDFPLPRSVPQQHCNVAVRLNGAFSVGVGRRIVSQDGISSGFKWADVLAVSIGLVLQFFFYFLLFYKI